MSDTTASLRRKIGGANDLQSVVRTMKAVAAASIGQYEQSVAALDDYYRTVELGLGVCFRNIGAAPLPAVPNEQTVAGTIGTGTIGAIVFGSDQGLVGQFNDLVADHAVETLATLPAKRPAKSPAKPPAKPVVWAVGGRVQARLTDAGLSVIEVFAVPSSIKATTPLIGQILVASETGQPGQGEVSELHLFYNRPTSGAGYAPAFVQRLLPLDESWRRKLLEQPWPTGNLPEVMGDDVMGGGRPCGHSSANIFSSRSSGRAPNPWPARTPAGWRPCNAPTKISTNCWRNSMEHSIGCAKVASMKSCLMSSPALKH